MNKWCAVLVLLVVGCEPALDNLDAGIEVTHQGNAFNLGQAIACVGLESADYIGHGCYCGLGNAYFTADDCHPAGGVQLDGPTLDRSDDCCKEHDRCVTEPWVADHACYCGAYNPFGNAYGYSGYPATCERAEDGAPGQWRCGASASGNAAQDACRNKCCDCDAAFARCIRAARDRQGGFDPAARRAMCMPLPRGTSGQHCATDADCTLKPWAESSTCDGGAGAPYSLACFEGWCYRDCSTTACPAGQMCEHGRCW